MFVPFFLITSFTELELFGQMRPERTMELVRTDRIPLIVLESGVVPMTENVQIDLRRGFRHTIALKQQVVEGVPLPYNFACVDYRTMGPQVEISQQNLTS